MATGNNPMINAGAGRHTTPERTADGIAPDRPVAAYLLGYDLESRGGAERAGLSLQWRGPDAGNPDPAAVWLVDADRPLDAELLERVTALR